MNPLRAGLGVAVVAVAAGGALWKWPDGLARGWAGLGHKRDSQIEFNRDIRPILNQSCTSCHGGVKQAGQVSFIYREEALGRGKSGRPVVVPGDPGGSELIARVTSQDPQTRMPLNAQPLSPKQIALLRQWIKEGAQWQDYWAFAAPKPQQLPAVKDGAWIKQPLDRFVLARLEKEGLRPSPEADKALLLRRVSFDLTGLPPTPEETAAFLADESPTAYEKQVDRLLASPRYGERWASMWLDLARFAESKGYEEDGPREGMWPYRDWVINALNANMPYDQFVIKQLAGDLLPNATFEDRIATAFHRQTPANDEAGTDDEEYRLVAVMDRVATTWSVLNGVTFNCVQCHSHPYDPIRHVEYYKFLAFFNTTQDSDLGDERPTLRVPEDRSQYSEAFRLQNAIAATRKEILDRGRALTNRTQWRPLPISSARVDEVGALEWKLSRLQVGFYPLEDVCAIKHKLVEKKKSTTEYFKEVLAAAPAEVASARARAAAGSTPALTVKNGEAWADEQNTADDAFYALTATTDLPALTALRIEVPPLDPATARHTPEPGFIVNRIDAWIETAERGEEKIRFHSFAVDDDVNLKRASLEDEPCDGSVFLGGFAADPKLFQTRWIVGTFSKPLSLPRGAKIKVRLTQMDDIDAKPAIARRVRLSATDSPEWTALAVDPALAQARDRLQALQRQLKKIPAVDLPVMVEQPAYERRTTLEFERGNFLTKTGAALQPGVPAMFRSASATNPRDRLALARWFFSPGQPLTARVVVNRLWEQLFGTGIVETLEDFGSVGEKPTHPELLDWLALHFQNDLQWDMKRFLRDVVTSATYRQSAKASNALQQRDPRNRLLARGPRQRLTAEMVRDQALYAAGLLNPAMGGPSTKLPMPTGAFSREEDKDTWVAVTGAASHRRAIYVYVKRGAMYPSFMTFDASLHDVSLPRRIPTNTPLQALVTLNDPAYHEAARALAQRMVKEVGLAGPGAGDIRDAPIARGARLVLSRDLTAAEASDLRVLYDAAYADSAANTPRGKESNALTIVASTLLNLDAALTR